jgi:CRISPR-associated protein Csm5
MATTTYTLTCLSPVHVGSGQQFRNLDAVHEGGQWHLIDLDRVLARRVAAGELAQAMQLPGFTWKNWLRKERIPCAEVATYSLPCRADPEEAIVREALKDFANNPYLPGSSLKGALRTVLLWSLLEKSMAHRERAVQYLSSDKAMNGKREWLGQGIERAVLGGSPNLDLLRAIQVGDSSTVGLDRLALGLVWTCTLRNNKLQEKRDRDGEYKNFVEWLVPQTTLQLGIRIDDFLFGPMAAPVLRFQGDRQEAVQQLASSCNAFARHLADSEEAFLTEHGAPELALFHAALKGLLDKLPPGAFVVNIGWGGSWEVKTVADLLREPLGETWDGLRDRFRLGLNPKTKRIDWESPFPKSRRVGYDGGVRWPLGWVALAPGHEKIALPVPAPRAPRPGLTPTRSTAVPGAGAAPKPVNKGQTRNGTFKKQEARWVALFEGDEREAVIVNPGQLPADLQEGQRGEFYIDEASKKIGIRVRFNKRLG